MDVDEELVAKVLVDKLNNKEINVIEAIGIYTVINRFLKRKSNESDEEFLKRVESLVNSLIEIVRGDVQVASDPCAERPINTTNS